MSTPLADLGDYLIANSLATEASLFLGKEPPAEVDPCLTVHEWVQGRPGVTVHDRLRPAVEYPRFRLISRSLQYDVARQQAQTLYEALFQNEVYQNGTRYLGFRPLMTPFDMGPPDPSGRAQIGFILEVQEAA